MTRLTSNPKDGVKFGESADQSFMGSLNMRLKNHDVKVGIDSSPAALKAPRRLKGQPQVTQRVSDGVACAGWQDMKAVHRGSGQRHLLCVDLLEERDARALENEVLARQRFKTVEQPTGCTRGLTHFRQKISGKDPRFAPPEGNGPLFCVGGEPIGCPAQKENGHGRNGGHCHCQHCHSKRQGRDDDRPRLPPDLAFRSWWPALREAMNPFVRHLIPLCPEEILP